MAHNVVEDLEDLNINDLNLKYPENSELIKSSKGKDAILFIGYYYNLFRVNKN